MTLKLLRDGGVVDGCETVELAEFQKDPDAWSNIDRHKWAVVVAPDDDLSSLPAVLLESPSIYLMIPVYTDGRAYTHARTLRMHHGYTGELVAVGDIRRDQVEFMRRVGIQTVELAQGQSAAELTTGMRELQMPQPHKFYGGGAISHVG